MSKRTLQATRRRIRVRNSIRRKKGAADVPRLSVFRSNKNIYAQVIDDTNGRTVASASTLEKEMKGKFKSASDKAAAAVVGRLVAERATAGGVTKVVFDRGPYLYHGRVKALADAAREAGLAF